MLKDLVSQVENVDMSIDLRSFAILSHLMLVLLLDVRVVELALKLLNRDAIPRGSLEEVEL
jgi:hypothetical protein